MLPDKQILLDDVNGLARVADSDLEAILLAGLIEFLEATPLDADAEVQVLIDAAHEAQCLARQEVLALIVRKILEILEILGGLTAAPAIIFGNGYPEGVQMATGYALYRDLQNGGLWSHDTLAISNTGWVPISA